MKFNDLTSDITKRILAEKLFEEHMTKMPLIIYQVCRLCAHYLNADSASAWLMENQHLVCNMVINSPVVIVERIDNRKNTGFGYAILNEEGPLVINDIQNDTRGHDKAFDEQGLKTLIGTKILFNNSCIGVIEFFRRVPVPFKNSDIDIIERYSEMLTIALEHCASSVRGKVLWTSYLSHLVQDLPTNAAFFSESEFENSPSWDFQEELPKGLQVFTLSRIQRHLQQSECKLSCQELADMVVLSVTSCRRYLNYLEKERLVYSIEIKGDKGRPAKLYGIVNTKDGIKTKK